MRAELEKIEAILSKLMDEKAKLITLNPTADIVALSEQFNSRVVDEVARCKKIALEYVKDDVTVTASAADTGGGGKRRSSFSTTKRETVMLQQFSGEEKTAFLQYLIWKKQWLSHISEYEVKYGATMLLNHLDSKAKEQIIGFENEYDKAMEKLEKYYNDAKKIINACLNEKRSHGNINAHDYRALVSYKKCLTNNYTRLKACNLDHEMSNTAALGVIVRKLPLHEP